MLQPIYQMQLQTSWDIKVENAAQAELDLNSRVVWFRKKVLVEHFFNFDGKNLVIFRKSWNDFAGRHYIII